VTDYIWTRRDGESSVAHGAFQEYLHQGKARSAASVAEALGKSVTLCERWCAAHDWVSRSVAYDAYILTADTDGLVHEMAESRDENLALMRKLKAHLSNRLDVFIERNQDPTMLWTQALTAMAKVEQNFLMLKDDKKTSDAVTRVEDIVRRMEEEMAGRS